MAETERIGRSYMTLNRASEWRRALLHRLRIDGHAVVTDDSRGGSAVMITGSVDSTEYDFIWRDLRLDVTLGEHIIMKVSAYAANTTVAAVDGRTIELDSFLADASVPAEERLARVSPLFTPILTNSVDGPVNLRGRFIWLKLEFIMLESREVTLRKIKLLLGGERMIDYLTEIYRTEDGENGFLSRFLSIFDSLFFEMDDAIRSQSDSLDYRVAKGEMLRYMAQWLSVEDAGYLDDEQLRVKIRDAITEYRAIGVKRGIAEWIRAEYSVVPNIVEHFDVRGMIYEGRDRETYRRLFGDDPYKFFVILPEGTFSGVHESNLFMQRLRRRIPAHTEAEVIIAKRGVILENHTYLGNNSVLGDFAQANMDAGDMISHDIILGGADEHEEQ